PVWGDVERYFQAANADARTRIKLFRLAFDAAVSSFSGRQQLYERYYSGDPVRLAGTLYSIYDRDPYMQRVRDLLYNLEARKPADSIMQRRQFGHGIRRSRSSPRRIAGNVRGRSPRHRPPGNDGFRHCSA